MGMTSFLKTLLPDEPFFLSDGQQDTRYSTTLPPAVRRWCFVSLAVNSLIVAISSAIFENVGPLLVGAIFALFPLYMFLSWKDIGSTVSAARRNAVERSPFVVRLNLSSQWWDRGDL